MTLRRFVLAALSLGACATNNETAAITFDPCSPLAVAVAPTIGEAERAGVDAAIAAWDARIPTQMVVQSGADSNPRLVVRFMTGSALRAVYWDDSGQIAISSDKLAPEEYPIAIAHEMGHAFGLPHIEPNERASVMNVGNVVLGPTEEDAADVAAIWPSCASE